MWDQDLNLKNELVAGESWLYAIGVADNGKVFVGSNDGTLRVVANPLTDKESKKVLECREEIYSVYCDGNRTYCGDDKGVVSFFDDEKYQSRIETSETCMGLRVEDTLIYTIRDKDLAIHSLNTKKLLATTTNRAVIPGRVPIDLFGPLVNGHRSYIALPFRPGRGFAVHFNSIEKKFDVVAKTADEVHDMMIYGIAGVDNFVFTGDYAGIVKRWELNEAAKTLNQTDVIDVCPGVCVSGLVATDSKTLFVAGSDGMLRKVVFD